MRGWLIAATLALLPLPGLAQVETGALLRERGLRAAISALEQQPDRNFERGTLLALHAWERLAQNAADYGFSLRRGLLSGPRGRQPRKTPTPEALTEIATELLADLDRAQHVLAAAAEGDSFTLDLRDIWFDILRNGNPSANPQLEHLLRLDQQSTMGGMHPDAAVVLSPPVVRFDAADRSWLLARLHAASGAVHLALAFDPTPALRDLSLREPAPSLLPRQPPYYDDTAIATELAEIETELGLLEQEGRDRAAAATERRKALQEREKQVQEALRRLPRGSERPAALEAERLETAALRAALNAETRSQNQRVQALRRAIQARRAALPADPRANNRSLLGDAGTVITPLFVLQQALRQHPDAERVELAFDHWRAALVLDQRARNQAAAETDDDREWLRGPEQSDTPLPDSLLPREAPDDPRRIEEALALLDGRLLIPHPLLPDGTGVSLRAWAETPGPLDPLAVIQGSGVWPWMQRGPSSAFLGLRDIGSLLAGGLAPG